VCIAKVLDAIAAAEGFTDARKQASVPFGSTLSTDDDDSDDGLQTQLLSYDDSKFDQRTDLSGIERLSSKSVGVEKRVFFTYPDKCRYLACFGPLPKGYNGNPYIS
jgi:hypothetical protein